MSLKGEEEKINKESYRKMMKDSFKETSDTPDRKI